MNASATNLLSIRPTPPGKLYMPYEFTPQRQSIGSSVRRRGEDGFPWCPVSELTAIRPSTSPLGILLSIRPS